MNVIQLQVLQLFQQARRAFVRYSPETMKARPILRSLVLIMITTATGLAVRMLPLGLPAVLVKYGGSALWALMIYWIASTALSRRPVAVVAVLAGCLATAVEVFKLYHSPNMDAFRMTLPGILLLGRYFSFADIAVYWVAILGGAVLDGRMRRI